MTNFFLMSLAVADLLVCMAVMPFGVLVFLTGISSFLARLPCLVVCRFLASVPVLVCFLPDLWCPGLLCLHPPPHVHLCWKISWHQETLATEVREWALHPLPGGVNLGAGHAPRLSHPCPSPGQYGKYHAFGECVWNDQWLLPGDWLTLLLLHPYGDHGDNLRANSASPQEEEAWNPGRDAPCWNSTPGGEHASCHCHCIPPHKTNIWNHHQPEVRSAVIQLSIMACLLNYLGWHS